MRLAPLSLIPLALAVVSASCTYINQLGPQSCDRSEDEDGPTNYTQGKVVHGVYQSSDPEAGTGGGCDPIADFDNSGGSGGSADEALTPEEERAEAELLWFPGGMRYEMVHGLGEAPTWFQAYLSFGPYGAYDCESTLAEAAGNQVEFSDINDHSFQVINGSCSDYYLLVVAGTTK
jgi:hypothetical protein